MSNTIAQSLTALATAKSDIATAITNKGGTVNSGDGFSDFVTDIGTISTGTDVSSDTVTAAKMRSGTTAHDASGAAITGTIADATESSPVTENKTLSLAGKFCNNDIVINVPVTNLIHFPFPSADSNFSTVELGLYPLTASTLNGLSFVYLASRTSDYLTVETSLESSDCYGFRYIKNLSSTKCILTFFSPSDTTNFILDTMFVTLSNIMTFTDTNTVTLDLTDLGVNFKKGKWFVMAW